MDNQELNYYFAPTGGGEDTGYNDPVTSNFKGNIYSQLARESLQNIIDAHDPQKNSPVRAEFSLLNIRPDKLPHFTRLMDIFRKCRDYITSPDGKTFFNEAILDIAENREISILKISDYNTRGLSGDENDTSSDYYSLLESSGSSSKTSDRGGSFGLEKGAFFAASKFRMVFFSSIYQQNKSVFRGKLRLTSFRENSVRMQGVGSFSLPNQMALRNQEQIPELFRRNENGLDIYIINFKKESDWEEQIIKKAVNDFWLAIVDGKLIVKIDDILIDQNSIGEIMDKYFSKCDPDLEDSPNPIPYYNAYISDKSKILERKLDTVGNVKLHLLFNENPNQKSKVSHYRNTGMLIQKKSYKPAQSYSGVFVCKDEKGNQILRKLENPQHNQWKADNAEGTELSTEQARKAEREIKDFIIEGIDSFSQPLKDGTLEITDLEQYLLLPSMEEEDYKFFENPGIEETGTEGKKIEGGRRIGKALDNFLEITRKPVPLTITNKSRGKEADDKQDGFIPGGNGNGSGGQGRPGMEDVDGKLPLKQRIALCFRSFAVKEANNKYKHIIVLEREKQVKDFGKVDLKILAGTDDSFGELNISEARDGTISYKFQDNLIKDVLLRNKNKLTISFLEKGRFALKVEAYENK